MINFLRVVIYWSPSGTASNSKQCTMLNPQRLGMAPFSTFHSLNFKEQRKRISRNGKPPSEQTRGPENSPL
ncbi:hypothetical protein PRUPE_2G118100 [Prunus persica]|uniref:Uncharacterized protein n=1 Tax=Prunus persica TaxID=3760 RepID=A0A251QEL8_PRUPE|nr:hypothetical protein PRUPE_2G118100 [Prunus persica]